MASCTTARASLPRVLAGYDPALGRFTSADTVIPGAGTSQAWDRFAYAMNNPLRYIDPTGHVPQGNEDESNKNNNPDLSDAQNKKSDTTPLGCPSEEPNCKVIVKGTYTTAGLNDMYTKYHNAAFGVGYGGTILGLAIGVAGVILSLNPLTAPLGIGLAFAGGAIAIESFTEGFAMNDAATTFNNAADYAESHDGLARVTLYQGKLGSTLIADGDRNRTGLWAHLTPFFVRNSLFSHGGVGG